MLNKTYQLETLVCPSCAMKIEGAVKRIKGVQDIQVLFNSSRAKVAFEESLGDGSEIRKTIEGLGFEVLSEK